MWVKSLSDPQFVSMGPKELMKTHFKTLREGFKNKKVPKSGSGREGEEGPSKMT